MYDKLLKEEPHNLCSISYITRVIKSHRLKREEYTIRKAETRNIYKIGDEKCTKNFK
jgi:hypothetical protein